MGPYDRATGNRKVYYRVVCESMYNRMWWGRNGNDAVYEGFHNYGGYSNYDYGNNAFDDRMIDKRVMGGHGYGRASAASSGFHGGHFFYILEGCLFMQLKIALLISSHH